jgi:putative flippase GtrA
MLRKAGLFLSVGVVGLLVDAIVFFSAAVWLQLGFAPARLLASLIALTVTWWLNRSLAFREGRLANLLAEYFRYLAASSVGALANLAVSYPVSLFDAGLHHVPAYVIGAGAGLVVNYLLYDHLVFAGGRRANETEKV